MFVQSITAFIEHLGSISNLEAFDQVFLKDIAFYFSSFGAGEKLTVDQFNYLKTIFQKRWAEVEDKPLDYTFTKTDVNKLWIQLAFDLGKTFQVNYFNILIPSISNTIEPVSLTRLSDINNEITFFYNGEDNIIHNIYSLYRRFRVGKFSTYNSHEVYKTRALSLAEIVRLKAKQGDFIFPTEVGLYSNFWNYLKDRVLPLWQMEGEAPPVFSLLASIVESYFNNSNTPEGLQIFRNELLQWGKAILGYTVKEVNHLYSMTIPVNDTNYFLVELLTDSLREEPSQTHVKMVAIAEWLAKNNPSLIISFPALESTYNKIKVGPGFKAAELLAEISNLATVNTQRSLSPGIERLQTSLMAKQEIDRDILEILANLYIQRWKLIIGLDLDYTRTQTGENFYWIRIAQLLAGAKYIPANYYHFLMPTLKHDTEPVSKELLTVFPLSYYVLSENGEWLLPLEPCQGAEDEGPRLYNYNKLPVSEFTSLERSRIAFADKRFRYLESAKTRTPKEPSIYLTTILAIKNLVDNSVYPSETQKLEAESTFLDFYRFLRELPEDERQRLYAQKMYYRGYSFTFKEIMDEVDKDGCLTANLRFVVKLILDYLPRATFSKQIEAKLDIAAMRSTSAGRVLREYEAMNVEECTRKLLMIFYSIMTHEFEYLPLTGYKVSACGYSNTVPKEVVDIFNLIQPIVFSNKAGDVRHIYSQVMEEITKPTLVDKSWSTWLSLFNDTRNWLNSLLNQSLYSKSTYFEPTILLQTFLPLTRTNKVGNPKLENFLDYLVKVFFQTQSSRVQKILINLRFNETLNECDSKERKKILGALVATKSLPDNVLPKLCFEFLIHRLAIVGASICDSSMHFFGGKAQRYNPSVYREIKAKLESELEKHHSSKLMLKDLSTRLVNLSSAFDQIAVARITSYWQGITNTALVPNQSKSTDRWEAPIGMEISIRA